MGTQEINLMRILPDKQSWMSLLPQTEEKQTDVVTELFLDYASRLRDPVLSSVIPQDEEIPYEFLDKKEEFYNSMLEDSLADLILTYLIRSDDDSVKKLLQFSFLVSGSDEIIFELIELLDNYPFDPYWQLSQSVAQFEISRSIVRGSLLKAIRKQKRAGVLSCWDKYPLTRYRLIQKLNIRKAHKSIDLGKAKGAENKKHLLRENYIKATQVALETLNPESKSFKAGPYYFTLLNHHDTLITNIDKIMGLWIDLENPLTSSGPYSEPLSRRSKSKRGSIYKRTESEPLINSRASKNFALIEKTAQALISSNSDQILAKFNWAKENFIDQGLFPNIGMMAIQIKKNTSTPKEVSTQVMDENYSIVSTELTAAFKQRLHITPFSHTQIKEVLCFILETLKIEHHDSPESWTKELTKLAKNVFRLPLDNKRFWSVVNLIAKEVNLAKEMELFKLKGNLTHVWDRLFEGKASREMIDVIIHDLNCESYRLFRMLDPWELNPEILKFLDQSVAVPPPVEGILDEPEDASSYSMQNLFNSLSYLVTYRVLCSKDERAARKAVGASLELAERMLEMPVINLHLVMAITAALNKTALSRLDEGVWNRLNANKQKIIAKLNHLFNSKSNYLTLRQAVNSWEYPTIPFVGMLKGEFEYAVQKNEEREPSLQKEVVANLVENFNKTKSLLKATLPVKGQRTDAIPVIYNWYKQLKLDPNNAAKTATQNGEDLNELLDEYLYNMSVTKWPSNKT